MDMVKRFEVWLVNLDPTIGSEVKKTRPCMVVSPNVTNKYLKTVTIVPLTSTMKDYPTRVNCVFNDKNGQLVIDQIRSIDKRRLLKRLGTMDETTCQKASDAIVEMFKY
jgi:mRNA interferase MazF